MMRKPLLTSVTVRFFGGPGFGPDDSYPSINNNGRRGGRVGTNEFSFLTIERFIIRVRDSPFSSRTSVRYYYYSNVLLHHSLQREERERGKKGEIGITTNKANESIRS